LIQHAACQVSPKTDWAKECELPMLPLISFETGRRTQLNLLGSWKQLRQQMEVWF